MASNKDKLLAARVTPKMYEKLEKIANEKDKKLSELIRAIIENYLAIH